MTEAEIEKLLKDIAATELQPQRRPGQFTASELAEKLNCGRDKVRSVCRQLLGEKKIKPVKLFVTNIMGISQRVMGFEIVGDENI